MANRVLVVDDDDFLSGMVCRALTRRTIESRAVASAEAALTALEHEGPFTHLLTDLRLGGSSGLTLIDAALARWPELHATIMTGLSREEAGLPDGVRLLIKPFELAELLAVLGLG